VWGQFRDAIAICPDRLASWLTIRFNRTDPAFELNQARAGPAPSSSNAEKLLPSNPPSPPPTRTGRILLAGLGIGARSRAWIRRPRPWKPLSMAWASRPTRLVSDAASNPLDRLTDNGLLKSWATPAARCPAPASSGSAGAQFRREDYSAAPRRVLRWRSIRLGVGEQSRP
jgi:hypothetical protein